MTQPHRTPAGLRVRSVPPGDVPAALEALPDLALGQLRTLLPSLADRLTHDIPSVVQLPAQASTHPYTPAEVQRDGDDWLVALHPRWDETFLSPELLTLQRQGALLRAWGCLFLRTSQQYDPVQHSFAPPLAAALSALDRVWGSGDGPVKERFCVGLSLTALVPGALSAAERRAVLDVASAL